MGTVSFLLVGMQVHEYSCRFLLYSFFLFSFYGSLRARNRYLQYKNGTFIHSFFSDKRKSPFFMLLSFRRREKNFLSSVFPLACISSECRSFDECWISGCLCLCYTCVRYLSSAIGSKLPLVLWFDVYVHLRSFLCEFWSQQSSLSHHRDEIIEICLIIFHD